MATSATHRRQSGSPGEEPAHNYAFGDLGEDLADYLSRGAHQIRDITRGHEGSAVLVALAAGFGLGLVIGGIVGATQRRPKSWRDRLTAEGLGERLLQQIEEFLPNMLAERLPNR